MKKHYSRKKGSSPRLEEDTHREICNYTKLTYPDVIFHSDGSGLKLPMGLAKKYAALKSSRAIPDFFLAEPRGGYAGLYLEIKREGEVIFKQDGSLRKKITKNPRTGEEYDHLYEQAKMLDRLMHKGYQAQFVIGVRMATDVIDEYLRGRVFDVDV